MKKILYNLYMIYLFKALLIIQFVAELLSHETISYEALLLLLILVGLEILRQRLWDSIYLVMAQLIIVTLALYGGLPAALLFALVAYNFAYKKVYAGVAAVFVALIILNLWNAPLILLITAISSILGHVQNEHEIEAEESSRKLDQERELRYSLEKARKKLLVSQRETAHLAELKERNRIAREIHDSIGHNIAGILVQLQLAAKQVGIDQQKAIKTIALCTEKLSETLAETRDSLYNLKPHDHLGLDYVARIIDNFSFCPVNFSCQGDINAMPPEHLEAIAGIIKEALTNTARYSKATAVNLSIQRSAKLSNLSISDTGIGCGTISEGMGIRGMKERVSALEGTITIMSENGFTINCTFPSEVRLPEVE